MRKRDRLKLYPGHQHQWVQSDFPDVGDGPPLMVRCTVCGFEAPRNAAGLDGVLPPKTVPVTDKGVAT